MFQNTPESTMTLCPLRLLEPEDGERLLRPTLVPDRVARAQARIESGYYDTPAVIDACVEGLLREVQRG